MLLLVLFFFWGQVASAGCLQLLNQSFEENVIKGGIAFVPNNLMSAWRTTDINSQFEVWSNGNLITHPAVYASDGSQFIELNANSKGRIKQKLTVIPGLTYNWSFDHRARPQNLEQNFDVVDFEILSTSGAFVGEVISPDFGVGDNGSTETNSFYADGINDFLADPYSWTTNQGTFTIPEGVSEISIELFSVTSASDDVNAGNLLDNIHFSANLDLGDAPSSYFTSYAENGPIHQNDSSLTLGLNVDSDCDGQPTPNADGDDVNGVADDDGVIFPDFKLGTKNYSVPITLTNTTGSDATVCGWINFNRDYYFNDNSPEESCRRVDDKTSKTSLTFSVNVANLDYTAKNFYSRFRICSNESECNSPTGLALNGEVEDYLIPVEVLPDRILNFDNTLTSHRAEIDCRRCKSLFLFRAFENCKLCIY